MKRITVFCGSSMGTEDIYEQQARELGKRLASEQIELVYGGANVGLMGAVSNGALEKGGSVIGVIPTFLKTKEIAHEGLSQLILVDSMHERKTKMNDLCDAVIALPGGFGTLEELFEMLTWAQLGLHEKPIALLNTNGYYNDLTSMINSMVEKGFLKKEQRQMVLVCETIDETLTKLRSYKAPVVRKWISKETS